jgi:hypothetical protein
VGGDDCTTGGIVGLAVLQLDLMHFYTAGHLTDVCMGLAFGTLGLANLVAGVLDPRTGLHRAEAPSPDADPGTARRE